MGKRAHHRQKDVLLGALHRKNPMKFSSCLFAVLILPGWVVAQDPMTPPPPSGNAPAPKPTKSEKLAELMNTVQDKIESDDSLRGVYLAGGSFKKIVDMPGEVLQLSGKVMNPAQGQAVEKLVLDALQDDPYWREGEGPLTISTAKMRVSQGSPQLAGQLYGMGLTGFWKGEYEKAAKAFSKAMAEAPNDDVIRYWSAVNALAQGQEDKAKAKLRPLVEANPQGSRTPEIATSLERVQGPLRRQLMAMESELLLSL